MLVTPPAFKSHGRHWRSSLFNFPFYFPSFSFFFSLFFFYPWSALIIQSIDFTMHSWIDCTAMLLPQETACTQALFDLSKVFPKVNQWLLHLVSCFSLGEAGDVLLLKWASRKILEGRKREGKWFTSSCPKKIVSCTAKYVLVSIMFSSSSANCNLGERMGTSI